jgi:hypothetical protein
LSRQHDLVLQAPVTYVSYFEELFLYRWSQFSSWYTTHTPQALPTQLLQYNTEQTFH